MVTDTRQSVPARLWAPGATLSSSLKYLSGRPGQAGRTKTTHGGAMTLTIRRSLGNVMLTTHAKRFSRTSTRLTIHFKAAAAPHSAERLIVLARRCGPQLTLGGVVHNSPWVVWSTTHPESLHYGCRWHGAAQNRHGTRPDVLFGTAIKFSRRA